MSLEPSSFFAGLTRGCIRDVYFDNDRVVRDSIISTILGIGSSMLTLYILTLLGFV